MKPPPRATLLFPGQGAQKVGMGRALHASGGAPARRFAEADDALGVRLSDLMFDGPSDLLRRTEYLQPALVTLEVAEAERLRELGLTPVAAIGHSVGAYAALVVAGALDFADALRLVRARGRLMQETIPVGDGAMALVVGVPRDDVRRACLAAAAAGAGVVEVACHNAPEQTVIAGTRAAVDAALDRCEDLGAAIVDLAVSAPFHCALLAPMQSRFAALLAGVPLRAPTLPVYDNVTALPLTSADAVRHALVAQLTAPVLFEESLRAALAAGHAPFVHCGPGRGLAPLVRALAPDAPDATVSYLADYEVPA